MAQEWTYRRLCDAYREEKSSNALTALPPDFDSSLTALLQILETAAKTSSLDAGKELENARRQALGLLRLRRHKIVLRALLTDSSTEPEGMTEGEHALYDRVHGLSENDEKRLAGLVLPPAAGGAPVSPNGAGANGGNGGIGSNGGAAAGANSALRAVRILKDIPAYRGADGQTYGPFAPGQEASMPDTEAGWLLNGKMAESL